MGGTYGGTIEIDETRKPKAFDLVFTKGHASGIRNVGIYKFEGDRWIICLATRGPTRPRNFATAADSGIALETLERSGVNAPKTKDRSRSRGPSAKKAARAEVPTIDDASVATPTEIEGEWAMTEGVFNGQSMPESMVQWAKRITRGSVTSVVAGGQVMLKANFTIGDTENPRNIDYVNIEGPNRGKTQAGIFELSGDSLRICMSAPGKPRPGEFESKPGDNRSYTAWRRLI